MYLTIFMCAIPNSSQKEMRTVKNRTVAAFTAAVALGAVVVCVGCVQQNQVDVEQVRTYADPITGNIL